MDLLSDSALAILEQLGMIRLLCLEGVKGLLLIIDDVATKCLIVLIDCRHIYVSVALILGLMVA